MGICNPAKVRLSGTEGELQTSVVWVSISCTCTVPETISIRRGGMGVDDMFPFHKMWSNVTVNDFKFQMEVPTTPDRHADDFQTEVPINSS